jgi:glycosyltransferase involved in cell wall biosynthesis
MVINNATAWRRVGCLPRTYLLPNGVDRDVFRVLTPIDRRAPRVLWTGSELGRRRKGYDRLLLPLQRAFAALGIDCEWDLVDSYADDKRPPEAMAAWYNTGTVLVCASASEGTPNPALEAAACGCTIVSTPVRQHAGADPRRPRTATSSHARSSRSSRACARRTRTTCGSPRKC